MEKNSKRNSDGKEECPAAGMKQQRDNIVEEIAERLMDAVDWELLQAISENNL